jgi:tetratricopeptide (TPR) repeat protein
MVAAFLLLSWVQTAGADQNDAARAEVLKIGQVTGELNFGLQLRALLKKQEQTQKLLPAAVAMAEAKDPKLTYYGALTLARVAAAAKDYAACEKLYRVCTDNAVQLYSTTKINESYGGLINTLYYGKKYADSVRVCREVLELKFGDGKARHYLFIVEDRASGDFGFDDDPEFDPIKELRPDVHELMIQGVAKEGKFDQALKLADSLVRKTDGWKERQLRAWVLNEAGRYAEAIKVYEDVLDRIPKDVELTQKGKEVYSDECKYILSGVYLEAKKLDKSLEILKDLLDRHPESPSFNNDLGYIWADNGMNISEAEVLIRKALELDREQRQKVPDFDPAEDHDKGAYLDSLGWVLFKQKKFEEAKKYLTDALKDKDAQHIEIFDHLGDTCMALGQREAALEAWRHGLAVVGDDRREQQRKAEVEKKIAQHTASK